MCDAFKFGCQYSHCFGVLSAVSHLFVCLDVVSLPLDRNCGAAHSCRGLSIVSIICEGDLMLLACLTINYWGSLGDCAFVVCFLHFCSKFLQVFIDVAALIIAVSCRVSLRIIPFDDRPNITGQGAPGECKLRSRRRRGRWGAVIRSAGADRCETMCLMGVS